MKLSIGVEVVLLLILIMVFCWAEIEWLRRDSIHKGNLPAITDVNDNDVPRPITLRADYEITAREPNHLVVEWCGYNINADYRIVAREPNRLVIEWWDRDPYFSLNTDPNIDVAVLRKVEITFPYTITKEEPHRLEIMRIIKENDNGTGS